MSDALVDVEAPTPRTVALVLGSGGARGYAHIGVIDILLDAGVKITGIAGSSMGALVGGLLAAGKLDEYREYAMGIGRFEVLRMIDLSLSSPGAIRGEKAFKIAGDLLGDTQIEDLAIDYTAVAVDLLARREVWFQEGPMDVAIRASTAIPSFFAPVIHNGRVLVDGGVLNPVPVAPVAATHADRIVAVTLNGQGEAPSRPVAETAEEGDEATWSSRFRGTAARWFDADLLSAVRRRLSPELEEAVRARLTGSDADRPLAAPTLADPDPGVVEILQGSLELMQGAIERHRLADYAPDYLVSIPRSACNTLDYHRAEEMIDLGRRLATDALADLLDTAGD